MIENVTAGDAEGGGGAAGGHAAGGWRGAGNGRGGGGGAHMLVQLTMAMAGGA